MSERNQDLWTGAQGAHMLQLVSQQKPSVSQMETVNMLLPAVIDAVKRGKMTDKDLMRFRKAIGLGILSLVVPHIHCRHSTAFRISDRFVVDKSAPVPISVLNENWKLWFGAMKLGKMKACDLEVNELTERSLDKPIFDEIGEELCVTSPAVLWSMMRDGHLSQDKWYLFYMKDQSGVRRAVDVYWGDGGWCVRANSTSAPGEWGAGDRVVSRKGQIAVS